MSTHLAWHRPIPLLVVLPALAAGLATHAADSLALTTADGFALPQPGRVFAFPRDHGSHPEFAIEWWYVTGHLQTPAPQRTFGFQATFFRRTAPRPNPQDAPPASTPAFGHQQLYLAHMALLDVPNNRFHHQERVNRDGWDAAAATDTLDVRNGNWSLRLLPPTTPQSQTFELHGTVGADIAFHLQLSPRKPHVIFGTNGVSRKGADPAAASHYITFSRLDTTGTVQIDQRSLPVTGTAWMDHEFSSSQLSRDQVGWDWACLQLADGRELMLYRLRRADGTTDPFSTLAWVDPQGRLQHLGPERFTWTVTKTWRSPRTGAVYPAGIRLLAQAPDPGPSSLFVLEPLSPDQELTGPIGGIAYWEGACRVRDDQGRVIGQAYLELTGYAGTLQGRF